MITRKRRRLYFFAFVALFFALIPLVVLYADGYRFDAHWRLVATGSIALSGVPNDADVYINYQPKKSSAVFADTYYISDLVPGDYFAVVAKAGYWSWAKHVTVTAKNVSTADAFLLPQNPKLEPVMPTVAATDSSGGFDFFNSTATTSGAVTTNPLYAEVTPLFSTSTAVSIADPLVGTDQRALWYKGDQVFEQRSGTTTVALIYTAPQNILRLAFFPDRDDVLLVLTSSGLYAVETDRRMPQNIEPVYLSPKIDFRVGADSQIYLKEKVGADSDFYQVEL